MANDGRLRLRAQVMPSRHALATMHVATREPADANTHSDLNSFGTGTYGRDATDEFMAKYRGVLRNSPFIVQDGEIGVTYTAMFNSNFHVLGPERSEINGFEHHGLLGRFGNPCLRMPRACRLFLLGSAGKFAGCLGNLCGKIAILRLSMKRNRILAVVVAALAAIALIARTFMSSPLPQPAPFEGPIPFSPPPPGMAVYQ